MDWRREDMQDREIARRLRDISCRAETGMTSLADAEDLRAIAAVIAEEVREKGRLASGVRGESR